MLTCIENVLSASDLVEIDDALRSITFEDGKRTAGFRARRVKDNLQAGKSDAAQRINQMVRDAVLANKRIKQVAFPKRIHPVLISKYSGQMNYGAHVDDAVMASGDRADVAITLFLSPPESYVGGELYIKLGFGEIAVKLPRGAAVVYDASTIHRVAPVLEGERVAAVTWVESRIREASRRELLSELQDLRDHLHRSEPDGAHTEIGFKTYANLLRMWADT